MVKKLQKKLKEGSMLIVTKRKIGISQEERKFSIPCKDCNGYGVKPEYANYDVIPPKYARIECDTCGGSGIAKNTDNN